MGCSLSKRDVAEGSIRRETTIRIEQFPSPACFASGSSALVSREQLRFYSEFLIHLPDVTEWFDYRGDIQKKLR